MASVSRRAVFGLAAAAAALAVGAVPRAGKRPVRNLTPLTARAQAITVQEHLERVARVQDLMRQHKTAALLVESGSTLEYFTGIRWRRSERTTAALIPADGNVVVVTPFFEEPSVRETLKIPADVRSWKEDQSPFELIAAALRTLAASGPLAVEATTRYFIVEQSSRALGASRAVVPGEELVRACRMLKSPAELALLQLANQVTLAALRHLHGHIAAGMRAEDIGELLAAATEALGASHDFALVLLNEASSYPHGSLKPQRVREGSVILVDAGCTVQGYQSDISRTWVFGEPTRRQREVWHTVRRGQEIALEAARLGGPVGAIDTAVRTYYESRGWARDYGLPGLSHRTGHGIGMDGHEPPYLVRGDTTPLQAGMCFSDEPGLYIPGEFGIRLEDCWYMTDAGPKLFTPLARSLEQPI